MREIRSVNRKEVQAVGVGTLAIVLPAYKLLLLGFSHIAHSMQHYGCCQVTSPAVSTKSNR